MERFNVMVVDDEKDLLETLVKRLEKRNLYAVGAESAEEALALIEKKEFDVVILDIKLPGKMDGIALRVPTFNVSIVDLVIELCSNVTRDTVNSAFEEASKSSLRGILDVSQLPLVSSDYIGSSFSSIVDAEFTNVIADNLVKVLSWYDNEWGYSCRVIDMIQRLEKEGL